MDFGRRIAYMALEVGTTVMTSDGHEFGSVHTIRADFDDDIFDGLVVETALGLRFAEAALVADIYERAVLLALSREEAGNLPAV
jgi:hypothetical protein